MKSELEDKAKYLASQPYAVEILKDKTTAGDDIFLARNPDLKGCMAQGITMQEALANLADARLDYIESLLEDGEPIPEVVSPSVYTSGETEDVFIINETIKVKSEVAFLTDLDRVVQPVTREAILKIEPITV